MVWVAENIQACLSIFRRAQHQWLVRDILHQPQGVYSVFVLHPVSASKSVLSVVEKRSTGQVSHQAKDIVVAPEELILYGQWPVSSSPMQQSQGFPPSVAVQQHLQDV